jgi:SWI/SNF-related matrix-associated actin-dependent regulator of chromatin subfamily B protein 1
MEDYKFSNPLLGDTVLASVKEQVSDYHKHVYNSEYGDDLRVLIKLDITVSNNQLIDQFEWDISNPENNPEEFAQCLCEELSLPGDFASAISHSIREQVQTFTKALYLAGYDFKGGFIDEDEIRNNVRGIVTHNDYLRPKQQLVPFTPQLLEISNPELERLDKIRERDSRRKRRQGRTGRRGGPTLPDLLDVPRTFRTPFPSTILPGGINFTDNVNSYEEYVETIMKPVVDLNDLPQQSPLIANEIKNATPTLSKTTPRTLGRTIKSQRVSFTHEKGSRLLVTIKL